MTDTFTAVATSPEALRQHFVTGYRHAEMMQRNGENVRITVGEALESIGVRQRNFYHGPLLGQISEQARVEGQRFVMRFWKDYMHDLFLPDTFESRRGLVRDKKTGEVRLAKRATPHRVRHSTEDLGPKKYSELIDKVIAHAVTCWSVEFHFESDEREGVRYVRAARKPTKADESADQPQLENA